MNMGIRIEFSRPGKPTDKAHIESFNGRFRDESLDANLFSSIADAHRQVKAWRIEYNNDHPHSSLGWRSPMEFRNIFIKHSTPQNPNLSVAKSMGWGQHMLHIYKTILLVTLSKAV